MAGAGMAQQPPSGGRLNQTIANAVVRVYRAHLGRGPEKAHAFYRGNVVVVVLQEPFTTAERSLVDAGRQAAVRRLRQELERMMRDALADAVASATGCRVEAVMSDVHVDPDMSVEVFVLDRPVPSQEPAPGPGTAG
jgi:uncharacterized protein YbcI